MYVYETNIMFYCKDKTTGVKYDYFFNVSCFTQEACKYDEDLHFLSPLYMIESSTDEVGYCRDVEIEHRKQEEVLKRFRIHDCNLLIATSILEEGLYQ